MELYRKKRKNDIYESYTYFDKEPDEMLGGIVLLPLIQELDYRRAINLILEDLLGKEQTPLPPSWVENIQIKKVSEISVEISGLFSKINQYQQQIQNLTLQKEELEEYKKLLYSDGEELENIFRKCLEKLGGSIHAAKYSNEEYCLEYKGFDFPIEAKGVSKSISLTHLRQLMDYLLVYEDKAGEKCLGIMLGNAWKNIAIENRNTNEKPIFPDNVIKRAVELNIALISSLDFFTVFLKFLENESYGEKILDRIVCMSGIVDFSDI